MLGSSVSFGDFVRAAGSHRADTSLVLDQGLLVQKSPDHAEKLNRRTWRAFKGAVEGALDEDRVGRICERYGLGRWEDHRGFSHDFRPWYVGYFGVGAASAYVEDLEEMRSSLSFRSISHCTPHQIRKLYAGATRYGYLGRDEDPITVSGAPRTTHEQMITDKKLRDEQRCKLFKDVGSLVSKDPNIPRSHPYDSRLAMGITSLIGVEDVGLVIPAPGPTEGSLDFYKVYDVVESGGLTAIAYVPISNQSHLEPIIAFRCTKQTLGQDQAVLSILNDMEKNIGESGYEACKDDLAKLITDQRFTKGKRIMVICYSLGGAHAGYFMRDHWKSVKEFVGFNFVGNGDGVADELARQINLANNDEVPPAFYHYRNVSNEAGTLGDWVNKSGKKHIGCGIQHQNCRIQLIEWIVDDLPIPGESIYDINQVNKWLKIHGVRPMDDDGDSIRKSPFVTGYSRRYNIYKGQALCTAKLDTYKRDPNIENQRRSLGGFHTLFSMIYHLIDFARRSFEWITYEQNKTLSFFLGQSK